MDKFYKMNWKWAVVLYLFFDLCCIGLGMGVPLFPILYGFLVGMYITKRLSLQNQEMNIILQKIYLYSVATSFFTFILMCGIWGRYALEIFNPNADFANFGIPMILYEAKASYIGWMILMIFISPFLQLLMTMFGAHLQLLKNCHK